MPAIRMDNAGDIRHHCFIHWFRVSPELGETGTEAPDNRRRPIQPNDVAIPINKDSEVLFLFHVDRTGHRFANVPLELSGVNGSQHLLGELSTHTDFSGRNSDVRVNNRLGCHIDTFRQSEGSHARELGRVVGVIHASIGAFNPVRRLDGQGIVLQRESCRPNDLLLQIIDIECGGCCHDVLLAS